MADASDSPVQSPTSVAQSTPELLNRISSRDDLLALFFQLLWEKQGRGGSHHILEGVNIPDTVIVNHSRAIHWYFTSKDGSIKMKSKKHLTSTAVMEHMTTKKRISQSGAAAWITGRASRGVDEIISMRAANATELQMAMADGSTTGILQSFVDPKSESMSTMHNSVLVANWTPNVLYIERRVNGNDIRATGPSKTMSLEERTTLADGSRFVRVAPLVSTHTTQVLERLCQTVAQHIETIHQGLQVTNLVLYVKIDEENKPWLLFCSSIRVMHLTPDCRTESATLSIITPKTAVPGARSRSALAAPLSTSGDDLGNATSAGSFKAARQSSAADSREDPSGANANSSGSKQRLLVPRSRSKKAAVVEEPSGCSLCRACEGDEWTFLARRHILFPLAIVSFFGANPPGTLFHEDDTPGVVPSNFQLLCPGVTWDQYVTLRADDRWLDDKAALCSSCAAGLESITANLHVGSDGGIRVPPGNHPLGNSAKRTSVTKRTPKPQDTSDTKGSPGGGLPPLAPAAGTTRGASRR